MEKEIDILASSKNLEKEKNLNNGLSFQEEIGAKVQNILTSEEGIKADKHIKEKVGEILDGKDLENRNYYDELKSIIPKLEKIGLKNINGVLYFGSIKGAVSWPKINGRSLVSFPSSLFNKKHGLGGKDGIINSREKLLKLFEFFGFEVGMEEPKKEEEIVEEYRNQLAGVIPKLEEIGLININGVLYFHSIKGSKHRPNINGRLLSSFPNSAFNKKHGIGNNKGIIVSKDDLILLFKFFGFKIGMGKPREKFVENEEDLREYKNQLEGLIPKLEEIGLKNINGTLYFCSLKGARFWPNINGKLLSFFPNSVFNKKYGIGNKKGAITSKIELAKLFKICGFEVVIDGFKEEEKIFKYYKNQLEGIIPELEEIGLKNINGVLYFGSIKGAVLWPNIDGKSLIYFPNSAFNKKYGIGGKKGTIFSKEHLVELFKFFGFKIGNDESIEKEEVLKEYRKQLEDFIPKLERIGLKNINGVLYFDNLKWKPYWPKINGKSLYCFPSTTFNKKYGIGKKDGLIKTKKELGELFQFLGFNVSFDGLK